MLRGFARRALGEAWRRQIRALQVELRERIRDAVPDLLDVTRTPNRRLPPARVRARVGRTSSRHEFVQAGAQAFEELQVALGATCENPAAFSRCLDFGCGSGRIARHFTGCAWLSDLVGIDIDEEAVAWARRLVPGAKFLVTAAKPPTPLPSGAFDMAYAASVFTHFDEEMQLSWLGEMRRLLRPGGLLLASTHSPETTALRPDIGKGQLETLAERGYLFAPGGASFNSATAVHARSYLEREWGKLFQLLWFREKGLFSFQDLSVWEKR